MPASHAGGHGFETHPAHQNPIRDTFCVCIVVETDEAEKANTIAIELRKIRYLQRHVNLWDDQAVSAFIQDGTWSGSYARAYY